MSIENKQLSDQPAVNEHSVADDLITIIRAEEHEAGMSDVRDQAFGRFQAGEISREQYNDIVQAGTHTEAEELWFREKKEAALNRINNNGQPNRLGRFAANLFRRK